MGKTPIAPLYTIDDAMASLKQFVPIDYDQEINPVNGIRAIYKDAAYDGVGYLILCNGKWRRN